MDKNQKHYLHSSHTDFRRKRTTEIHRNPGRISPNKPYEYYERLMSCKKCVKYGNKLKRCRETIATCARCSNQGHNKDQCTGTEVRCYHCDAAHQSFLRNCLIIKKETEIIQIQIKECLPRLQAIRKLLGLNPNPELIFSGAVKKTPLIQLDLNPRLVLKEKVNPTQVVRTCKKNYLFILSGYITCNRKKMQRQPRAHSA